MAYFGGLEAGGTKFVCAVGSNPDDLSDLKIIPTTTPAETIGKVIEYFHENQQKFDLQGIGVGTFGPVDLNPKSDHYGYITSTPKAGWANTDLAGILKNLLGLPITIDTDVNAAAVGESIWGAGIGLDYFLYTTVGTGIGMGGLYRGRPMHGLAHPENGHMLIPHQFDEDPYPGMCPFHGDCLEGLASGPAIQQRWGLRGERIPIKHPAWDLESTYLAYYACNLVLAFSPQRIIFGGGVMQQESLLPAIRQKTIKLLNGYIQQAAILEETDHFIVRPKLGSRAGILGAIAIAQKIYQ